RCERSSRVPNGGRSGDVQARSAMLRSLIRGAAVLLVVAAAVVGWLGFGRGHKRDSAPKVPARHESGGTRSRETTASTRTQHLVALRTGRLVDPVQDASAVAVDPTHAMLLGGLTRIDTSTDNIRVVSSSGDRPGGHLPSAVHDSA